MPVWLAGTVIQLGSTNSGTQHSTVLGLIYNRQISAREATWLNAEPFAMLYPAQRRSYWIADSGAYSAALTETAATADQSTAALTAGAVLARRPKIIDPSVVPTVAVDLDRSHPLGGLSPGSLAWISSMGTTALASPGSTQSGGAGLAGLATVKTPYGPGLSSAGSGYLSWSGGATHQTAGTFFAVFSPAVLGQDKTILASSSASSGLGLKQYGGDNKIELLLRSVSDNFMGWPALVAGQYYATAVSWNGSTIQHAFLCLSNNTGVISGSVSIAGSPNDGDGIFRVLSGMGLDGWQGTVLAATIAPGLVLPSNILAQCVTAPFGMLRPAQRRRYWIAASGAYGAALSETAATDDQCAAALAASAVLTEAATTASVATLLPLTGNLSETAASADSSTAIARGTAALSETAASADTASATGLAAIAAISDSTTSGDSLGAAITMPGAVSDSAASATQQSASLSAAGTIAETASSGDQIAAAMTASAVLTDGAATADQPSVVLIASAALAETAASGDTITGIASGTYSTALSESAGVADQLATSLAASAALTDGAASDDTATGTAAGAYSAVLSETAATADQHAAAMTASAALTEAATSADSTASVTAGSYTVSLSDSIGAGDSLITALTATSLVLAAATTSEILLPSLPVAAAWTDTVSASDQPAVMLFGAAGTIIEALTSGDGLTGRSDPVGQLSDAVLTQDRWFATGGGGTRHSDFFFIG